MPTVSGLYKEFGTPVAGRTLRMYRRDTGAMLGEVLSSDGTPVPGDSSYPNVSLLLHMDDATDSSQTPKILTVPANSLVAAGAKFGASGFKPANSAGITIPSHADFALPGDFTFECWFYANSFSPQYATLFNIGAYNSGVLFRVQPSTIELWINGSNTNVSATISTGVWHHIAWSRSAGSVTVVLDGEVKGVVNNGGSIGAGNILIGVSAHSGGEYLDGYIDEIRLTKGVSRYSGAYTPPTAPFPNTATTRAPAVGDFYFETPYTGEVQVVALDHTSGTNFNDQIFRTTPV